MWTTWLARTLAAHDADEYLTRQARRRSREDGERANGTATETRASADSDVAFTAPCVEG